LIVRRRIHIRFTESILRFPKVAINIHRSMWFISTDHSYNPVLKYELIDV